MKDRDELCELVARAICETAGVVYEPDYIGAKASHLAIMQADAALSALEAAGVDLKGWRTIETAPQSGEFILLADERVAEWTVVAFWDDTLTPHNWSSPDNVSYHRHSFTHWCQLLASPKVMS